MLNFTVWYSIKSHGDELYSIKCSFDPTKYPKDCATEIAECLHRQNGRFYDGETIIIYESEDGPEAGCYELSVDLVVRYSAYKVERENV